MRKYTLLFGALGGAMAGYLFSNDKLRKELATAKTADDASKILGKHLAQDGKKIGGEVKKFVDSDMVQDNMSKMKTYAQDYIEKAKDDVAALMKSAEKKVMGAEKKAVKAVKKAVKKVV
ncbi:MAG: hypothetical protein KBC95_00470 [Candidatus Peribacteraceae bacterium]|nr:hypothetical protein [Candidatus Peribacteraceae bacterium]